MSGQKWAVLKEREIQRKRYGYLHLVATNSSDRESSLKQAYGHPYCAQQTTSCKALKIRKHTIYSNPRYTDMYIPVNRPKSDHVFANDLGKQIRWARVLPPAADYIPMQRVKETPPEICATRMWIVEFLCENLLCVCLCVCRVCVRINLSI